jgi:hypothetical protein
MGESALLAVGGTGVGALVLVKPLPPQAVAEFYKDYASPSRNHHRRTDGLSPRAMLSPLAPRRVPRYPLEIQHSRLNSEAAEQFRQAMLKDMLGGQKQ